MNALVDDLFTFPIGSADGDGGETKVHLITGGQTWSFGKSLLLDSAFGISMFDQFCSSPDFNLGMMGLDLGIPGTNDQGRNDFRYAGMPEFRTGFTTLGNTPTWSPTYRDEGTVSFSTNVTKIAGSHDFRMGTGWTTCTSTTGSRNAPTRADGSTSPATPRGRSAPGRRPRTSTTRTPRSCSASSARPARATSTELFTGREWQNAMFFRDRWSVSQKLTLDLGMRWEYYPIMSRADRQIEMLDRQTLDVLIGGVGGNPKNMGIVAPKDLFTPRAGAVYRLNDNTVMRAGYGATLDARGMSSQEAFRGDFSYPLVLNASFPPPAGTSTFGWYGTINQGIPRLEGPDLSSGRIKLPNSYGMQTAVPESTHRGRTHSWNVAFERRLPIVSVDVAYVGNRLVGGLPPAEGQTININNVQHMGGGDTDRPYFISNGRQLDIEIYSPWRRTTYHALQVGMTRPFTKGLLLKGHYTLSRSMGLRTDYEVPTAEAEDRNWALANGDRLHTFTMAFMYQLPWRSEGAPEHVFRAVINDWQLNGIVAGFSGAPFTVTADGTDLEHAGQHADRRSRRDGHQGRRDRRRGRVPTIRPPGRNRRAFASEPAESTSSAVPAAGTSTSRCSAPFRWAATRKIEVRLEGVQHHEHVQVREPDEQFHERRFHADLRLEPVVCRTPVPARPPLQLLGASALARLGRALALAVGAGSLTLAGSLARR